MQSSINYGLSPYCATSSSFNPSLYTDYSLNQSPLESGGYNPFVSGNNGTSSVLSASQQLPNQGTLGMIYNTAVQIAQNVLQTVLQTVLPLFGMETYQRGIMNDLPSVNSISGLGVSPYQPNSSLYYSKAASSSSTGFGSI